MTPPMDESDRPLSPQHREWEDRCMAGHAAEAAKGLHDGQCEYGTRLKGRLGMLLLLCHCSKRRREAKGFTTPPDSDLYFPPPTCSHCHGALDHDGDGWQCDECRLSWDSNGLGHTCSFTDDYGDLAR